MAAVTLKGGPLDGLEVTAPDPSLVALVIPTLVEGRGRRWYVYLADANGHWRYDRTERPDD